MGAKIITEKDFWMCTSGAMPAQLQGTRESIKKITGEKYITVADTATSSWIDFGCTKNMLLAALLTAIAVVVIVVLVVGTGGVAAIGLLGMMAIGAGAGFIGGTIAAVHGALKCGQKNAGQRQWSDNKKNLILTGTPSITGEHTMICKIGGTVSFAPEVKSWLHAISLGGLNYLTKLAECSMAGAAVGAGGYLFAGLGSGTLALAKPTLASIASNVAGGFTGIWGTSRVLFGLDAVANDHAMGKVNSITDAGFSVINGGIPEFGMAKRLVTGHAQPMDYLLFLNLLNIKAGRNAPQSRPNSSTGDKDGNNTNKEEGNNNKTPEDDGVQAKQEGEGNNSAANKKGDAFEDPVYRQDNTPYSNQGRGPGRLKSSIAENGNLIPANKNGKATVQDHVRGSEPRKSDSAYTSFSEGAPGIGKKYGNNVIEVDIKNLEADIQSGKVKDVEVLRPDKVQAELQSKIDAAQQKYNNNMSEANLKKLEAAKQDLSHAVRDSEILIKGEIPSEYIKVYPQ